MDKANRVGIGRDELGGGGKLFGGFRGKLGDKGPAMMGFSRTPVYRLVPRKRRRVARGTRTGRRRWSESPYRAPGPR